MKRLNVQKVSIRKCRLVSDRRLAVGARHALLRTVWMSGALIVLLALLAPAATTHAQGMFGILPEPVTSDDLDRYADRLMLSDEQLFAVSAIHAQYLADYRRFREREVDGFLDQLQQNIPRRLEPDAFSVVKDAVQQVQRLMSHIGQLDDEFFFRMQAVLTPEQLDQMSRVRMHRDRSRLATEAAGVVSYVSPAVLVDLAEMIDVLPLSPEQVERIDPIVADYERRLTRSVKRLYELGMKKAVEIVEVFESLELTEESIRDPRQLPAMMHAAQTAWQEHVREFLDEAASLAAMQRRAYRQFAEVLPHEHGRTLRRAYFRRAYSEAAHIGIRSERMFNAAMSLDQLDARTGDAVRAMAAAHMQRQDRRADQIADLLDELRHELTFEQAVRRDRDPRRQRATEIREESEKAEEQAIDSLLSLLGDQAAEKLTHADGADRMDDEIEAVLAGRRGAARGGRLSAPRRDPQTEEANHATEPSLLPLSSNSLPRRMTYRDMTRYARALALNEGSSLVLDSLYEDYVEVFDEVLNEHVAPLDERARRISRDARDGTEIDNSAVAQLAKEYREAFNAIRALDERFFRDIKLALLSPGDEGGTAQLERLRMQRERDAYIALSVDRATISGSRAMLRWSRATRTDEWQVDLVRLMHEMNSEPGRSVNGPLDTLASYEQQLTALLRETFETSVAMNEAMTRMVLVMRTRESEGSLGGSAGNQRRQWRELGRQVRRVSEDAARTQHSVAMLNRRTLLDLVHELPPQQAEHLRQKYNRQAFAFIYDDGSAADHLLTAALIAQVVSDSQRSRLRDLALQYRSEYATLSQGMVDLYLQSADAQDNSSYRGLDASGRNKFERLWFERDELNRRTLRQIHAILSPDQLERIEQASG